MSAPKAAARIILLAVVLVISWGVLVYVQNQPPPASEIEQRILAGDLWGEARDTADDLFKVAPVRLDDEPTDTETTERWLYQVTSQPNTYYLIRVQNGVIAQAQRAGPQGDSLRSGDSSD